MNWDDFRYFLNVSRTTSIRATAELMGVNHATVARRIEALETQHSTQLFDRSSKGYHLNTAGKAILPEALAIEQSVTTLNQRLRGLDETLSGEIHVSLSDGMVAPMTPILARFQAIHPDIYINLMVNNTNATFDSNEGHLAIRFTLLPPEKLVGRRVGLLPSAAYTTTEYLQRVGESEDVNHFHWIGWDKQWDSLPAAQWLKEHVAPERVIYRVDSSYAMRVAVKAGMGVAHLMCMEANAEPELIQVGPKHKTGMTNLWLVTHPELRKLPRLQSLMNFITDEIRMLYDL